MVMQSKQSVNTGKRYRLLTGPAALRRPGMALKHCLFSIHAGLCAINEFPLPACCGPGFCPSAAIISPHVTALLYCMWLFFSGSLWHLAAHLVDALFQSTRQQLPAHPAPSINFTSPTQSSLVAEIIIPLLEAWLNSRAWLQGSLFTVYCSHR